eukprot:TRINITY_DN71531_c0_g1_i1.p1 TRINITY_DN71531_c0_g1~~TRINITY_DN71531_c0_g1_i1.p1  ORF type:complete len:197 (-),score=95.84 TRINITY_DN71531_c0_g1_i1:114-704(-)
MGYTRYFIYKHPITNFVFQDPLDGLRGMRRRSVIVSVAMITFLANLILNEFVFDDDDSLSNDWDELRNNMTLTRHLIITVLLAVALFLVNLLLSGFYALPDTWLCSSWVCSYCKYKIYYTAFMLFLLNALLFVFMAINKVTVFMDWLVSYGLYAAIVTPITITASYVCFGGKESEAKRDRINKRNSHQELASMDYA